MGCWLSKTVLEADPGILSFQEDPKKTYSWDKREKLNPDEYTIEQVHFGECGRLPGSINGQAFVVRDCSDAAIFLLDHINTLTIDDCNNCTIVVGPTAGSVFVRECVECVVVVACGQFRTRDCRQLQVRLLCNTQPIIEASTRVRLSCYQLHYKQLAEQFKAAGLSPFNNSWSEVHDFTPPDDGDKNWTVAMPAALPALKMPSLPPLNEVGLSTERSKSVVPYSLGSVNPPSHRCLNEEPLLVMFYHNSAQYDSAKTVVHKLQHSAGLGSILCTRECRLTSADATRVLGADTAAHITAQLAPGPVLALLVDAPYEAIQQAVEGLRDDHIYVSPNNGIGFNQANTFFSFASLSMAI